MAGNKPENMAGSAAVALSGMTTNATPDLRASAAEELEGWRWWVNCEEPTRFLAPPSWNPEGDAFLSRIFSAATGSEPVTDNPSHPLPDYAADLHAVARLESVLAERGKLCDYGEALMWIVCGRSADDRSVVELTSADVTQIATADAATRFRAVCVVLGWGDEAL